MGVGRPLAKWELKKNRLDPLTSGVFSKESVLGKYLQKVEIQKLVSLKLYAPVYPLKRLCVLEARTPHSEGHGPEGECVSFSTWHRAQPAFVCISSPAGQSLVRTHTLSPTPPRLLG